MRSTSGPARTVDSLRNLLERLSSPDVTLIEAKALRSQVYHLLEETDHATRNSWETPRRS
ncbi:MAG: hypothetical protein JO161_07770 [Planctomycetaceae bacterium]|nr:hypothetical protein [Planctomycetaceae bacterium]